MDFDLNDDQRLLKDSVDRLIADKYGFDQRRAFMNEEGGWSRAMWAQFAELGLLGLPFAEEHGGFGGGPVETMIVAEAFGRGLVLEPYLATVVLGGGLLRRAAGAELQADLLPKIAAGDLLLAFAHVERQSRYDLHDVSTIARQDGSRWRLEGEKGVVLHGDVANKLLVTARTSGGTRDRSGIGLFLVDVPGEGVSVRGYATQDGLRAAEVSLAGATGVPLGDPAGALPQVERVVDEALAYVAAEAVGVMTSMQAATVDYMKQRKQFGRAIGEFQALQHRAVDMYVLLEQARSMALLATMMTGEDDPTERHRAVAAAKVQIGRSGRKLGQEAVQLHGGIGVTMEYMVGHYFKRMSMIELLFGDADTHLAQLAAEGGVLEAGLNRPQPELLLLIGGVAVGRAAVVIRSGRTTTLHYGGVMTDRTSGRGAQNAMMAGIVPSDATNGGARQAANGSGVAGQRHGPDSNQGGQGNDRLHVNFSKWPIIAVVLQAGWPPRAAA